MSEGKKGVPPWVVGLAALGAVVVALVPLALYGVRKYLLSARQAEAKTALVSWGDGLVQCGENTGLPPSSTPIPASFSAVAGKKYQSRPTEWGDLAHTCAGFEIKEPQYFQYIWELTSPTAGTLHARADLDGDGVADAAFDLQVTCSDGKCARQSLTELPSAAAAELAAAAARASAAAKASPALDGAPIDLSTVMGRARKLANAWEPDAPLLGIEATLLDGFIQTQDGASAKVTFAPAAFVGKQQHTGLFVVTYDKSGINGAPLAGTPGRSLPEPMCAPEGVLPHLGDFKGSPIVLRYGLDGAERPGWLVSLPGDPKLLRAFAPDDCAERGTFIARPKH